LGEIKSRKGRKGLHSRNRGGPETGTSDIMQAFTPQDSLMVRVEGTWEKKGREEK